MNAKRFAVLAAVGAVAAAGVFVPSAGASPDACVGLNGVTITDGGASTCSTTAEPGSAAAVAAANESKAEGFSGNGGVSIGVANHNSEVDSDSSGGGVAIGAANDGSNTRVIGSGGVAAASADGRSNVQAASVNNRVALAAAAGASNASATTTTPPTCSGPGLALAARSDGAFCVDVLGFVATG